MKKIKFTPKHTIKSGAVIASMYTADGSYPKKLPVAATVGDLKQLLAQLPDKLPIFSGFAEVVQPTWFNIGHADEHLEFEEPDDVE